MTQTKSNLYLRFSFCNCIWFLYFLSVYQNAGNIILLLFIFSAISFFAFVIAGNDHVPVNKKKQFGIYLVIRLVCFFCNIYLIRYYDIFVGSYVVIFFQVFEMITMQKFKCLSKIDLEYNDIDTRKNYINIFLIGMIVFVSVSWIEVVKYTSFLLVLFLQLKMLQIDIKTKYLFVIIEIIYILIYLIFKIDLGILAFILMGILYNCFSNSMK